MTDKNLTVAEAMARISNWEIGDMSTAIAKVHNADLAIKFLRLIAAARREQKEGGE